MLEQWHANQLLHVPKVYSSTLMIDIGRGADHDYPVESDDGNDHFLLDVRASHRNPRKVRLQLRYRRDIVIARLCTAVPHTNPDGRRLGFPHLHLYREGQDDKWAEELADLEDKAAALEYFCTRVRLPAPTPSGV